MPSVIIHKACATRAHWKCITVILEGTNLVSVLFPHVFWPK